MIVMSRMSCMKNCEKPLASACVMLVYDNFAFSFLCGFRSHGVREASRFILR